jgi:hypothetical protein
MVDYELRRILFYYSISYHVTCIPLARLSNTLFSNIQSIGSTLMKSVLVYDYMIKLQQLFENSV